MALLFALGLVGFIIYFPGIDIQYYEDDFSFVFNSTAPEFLYYFYHKNPQTSFYRPVDATFLSHIQSNFSLNPIPVHVTIITLHIFLAWLIALSILKIGFSYIHAVIGSVFMVISQANAFAVLSLDTLSQVSGTLFGCISILFLYMCISGGVLEQNNLNKVRLYGYFAISVLAFGISLLSKEASVSFFPLLLFIILANKLETNSTKNVSTKKLLIALIPFVAILFLYFITRSLIGTSQATIGSGRYNFYIGTNIIKNLITFLFALFIPGSSVGAFVAFKTNSIVTFVMFVIGSLAFICCVVYGLWHVKEERKIIAIAGFMICALFPMALLNHVSELYIYNAMPFLAVLVGVSGGEIAEIVKRKRWLRKPVIIVLVLFILSHIIAIQGKILYMKSNGERAASMISQLGLFVDKVNENGHLILLNKLSREIEYSGYLMKDFNVIRYGEHRIKKIYNREDITIEIMDERDIKRVTSKENALVLRLIGEEIVAYSP